MGIYRGIGPLCILQTILYPFYKEFREALLFLMVKFSSSRRLKKSFFFLQFRNSIEISTGWWSALCIGKFEKWQQKVVLKTYTFYLDTLGTLSYFLSSIRRLDKKFAFIGPDMSLLHIIHIQLNRSISTNNPYMSIEHSEREKFEFQRAEKSWMMNPFSVESGICEIVTGG